MIVALPEQNDDDPVHFINTYQFSHDEEEEVTAPYIPEGDEVSVQPPDRYPDFVENDSEVLM